MKMETAMRCGDCLLYSPMTEIPGLGSCIDGDELRIVDDYGCIDWSPRPEECAWFAQGWCRGKKRWCWEGACPAWDHVDYEIEKDGTP